MRPSAVSTASSNKLLAEDRAVHDWYRFVLSFPPHLVRRYLDRFEVSAGRRVLDPFCGTGTTLVECKKLGIASVGIEANPMAHFASRVKVDWTASTADLDNLSTRIAASANRLLERDGSRDDGLKRLDAERLKLILKNSISPRPLHKVLVLLELIEKKASPALLDHQKLALAREMVESASNLHFGPEVGLGKIKADAPVVAPWLSRVRQMADDLSAVEENRNVEGLAIHGDARELQDMIEPRSIDFVFTSPPYPNEKDYTRTTRLESVILGFINDKAELRQFKQGLLRSNTRNVYKADDDDRTVDWHPEIQSLARKIEARRKELGKTSGFERLYARVTKLYFGGMARHFEQLKPVLRPGAHLAYVVGDQASYFRIMIRTGRLLGEVAERLGYEFLGLDLFRARFSTATGEYLNEEVLLLRFPG